MKKLMSLIIILAILGLVLTKSLYVELDELIIIIVLLSLISSIRIVKSDIKLNRLKSKSIIIVFLISWILAISDIVIDHFLYYFNSEYEDGRSLRLIEKIQEFNDDLLVLSIIATISVGILSFIVTKIYLRLNPES